MVSDTLFDLPTDAYVKPPVVAPAVDWERLERVALLYTATALGNATGIHFAATIEDAQRWCSSPVSRGVMHGTEWAYFWTSAANYVRHHQGDGEAYGGATWIDMSGHVDNGDWDERIAAAGVNKIGLPELVEILRESGVHVIGGAR